MRSEAGAIGAAKSASNLHARALLPIEEHKCNLFSFPPSQQLIVTTTSGVFVWDMNGLTEIFRSGSEGIVAAKKVGTDNGVLAVADSQVVVLHNIEKGMQRSYRLKGSEGQVRLLKYAGNSSKNLFFTTNLQNSVQAFSLKHSKLLDTSDAHPSPPAVFALSCSSHLLLSSSASPPTIHLRNLTFNTPPILLRPRCSSSAVVAADFHPERPNIFLLAFADGTAAVYDAKYMFRDTGKGKRRERAVGSGSAGEMASIKGLHASGTSTSKDVLERGVHPNGFNLSTGMVGIGSSGSGITAVALLPGHKAMAVTVGVDGKCCVVDFTQPSRSKAVLLKTWHLRRPGTSLSAVYLPIRPDISHVEAAKEADPGRDGTANKDYCIAVGRQDGKVLLFDLDGKLLGEQILDPKGARIIDVEWAQAEIGGAISSRKSGAKPSIHALPKQRSLGTSAISKSRPETQAVDSSSSEIKEQPHDSLFDFSIPRKPLRSSDREQASSRPSTVTVALNHLDMGLSNSPSTAETIHKSKRISGKQALRLRRSVDSNLRGDRPLPFLLSETSAVVDESPEEQETTFEKTSQKDSLPPPIPPRPTPKPGGRLSMRRAQIAYQASPSMTDVSITIDIPKENAGNPRFAKTLEMRSPEGKPKVLYGPRDLPPSQKAGASERPLSSRAKSSDIHLPPKALRLREPETPEDGGSNSYSVAPNAHDTPISDSNTEKEEASHELAGVVPRVSARSSTASLRSYTTAASHFFDSILSETPSESSNDIVVDWSGGSSRQPFPSPHLQHLHQPLPWFEPRPSSELKGINEKNKGHVGISAPTVSDGRDPPFEPLSAKKTTENKKGKKKGHISVAGSTTSDETIVEWPKLKKSPRMSDLSILLPEQANPAAPTPDNEEDTDSATALILEGSDYLTAASPPRRGHLLPASHDEVTPDSPHQVLPASPLGPIPPPSPRRPPPPIPAVAPKTRQGRETQDCACNARLQQSLQNSLEAFRVDVMARFEAQRVWFKDLVGRVEEGRKVEEEKEEEEEEERGREC